MDREEEFKNINFTINKYPSIDKENIKENYENLKKYHSSNDNIILDKGNIFPNKIDLKRRRRRIKNNYNKIKNNSRQKLIEMVNIQGCPLRDAAKSLGINYSTAKSIFRIYKLENRINKKNSVDELELKNAYFKLKKEKEKQTVQNNNFSSVIIETNCSSNGNDSNNLRSQIESLNDKIKHLKSNVNSCFDVIIENQNKLQNNFSKVCFNNTKFFNLESKVLFKIDIHKLKEQNNIYF